MAKAAAEAGTLSKLTAPQLKAFLKAKGATLSGSKSDLLTRSARLLGEFFSVHKRL